MSLLQFELPKRSRKGNVGVYLRSGSDCSSVASTPTQGQSDHTADGRGADAGEMKEVGVGTTSENVSSPRTPKKHHHIPGEGPHIESPPVSPIPKSPDSPNGGPKSPKATKAGKPYGGKAALKAADRAEQKMGVSPGKIGPRQPNSPSHNKRSPLLKKLSVHAHCSSRDGITSPSPRMPRNHTVHSPNLRINPRQSAQNVYNIKPLNTPIRTLSEERRMNSPKSPSAAINAIECDEDEENDTLPQEPPKEPNPNRANLSVGFVQRSSSSVTPSQGRSPDGDKDRIVKLYEDQVKFWRNKAEAAQSTSKLTQQRVDELQKENLEIESSLTKIRQEREKLQRELGDIQKSMARDKMTLIQEISSVKSTNEKLQKVVATFDADKRSVETRLVAAEKERDEVKADCDSQLKAYREVMARDARETHDLKIAKQNLERELQMLDPNGEDQSVYPKYTMADVEFMRNRLEELTVQVRNLKAENESLEEAKGQKEEQLRQVEGVEMFEARLRESNLWEMVSEENKQLLGELERWKEAYNTLSESYSGVKQECVQLQLKIEDMHMDLETYAYLLGIDKSSTAIAKTVHQLKLENKQISAALEEHKQNTEASALNHEIAQLKQRLYQMTVEKEEVAAEARAYREIISRDRRQLVQAKADRVATENALKQKEQEWTSQQVYLRDLLASKEEELRCLLGNGGSDSEDELQGNGMGRDEKQYVFAEEGQTVKRELNERGTLDHVILGEKPPGV